MHAANKPARLLSNSVTLPVTASTYRWPRHFGFCRFVDHMKASSPDVDLVHHVEPNEVHCYLMLQVPSMVEKGGKVLIDFIADVAANR